MDTRGYFNREAAGWSARYRQSRHFQDRLATVREWLLPKPDGLSLLDYGCGSAVMIADLLATGKPLEITGVDLSPHMIEAARQHLSQLGPDGREAAARLEVVSGADFSGGFAQRQYDGVLCMGVLEYVPDARILLTGLAERVGPGGFLMISVPNRRSWLRAVEQVIARHPGLFRKLGLFPHLTGTDAYLHYQRHRFSLQALDQWLQAQGLQRTRHRFHVAPRWLGFLAARESIGMTLIAEYRRPDA